MSAVASSHTASCRWYSACSSAVAAGIWLVAVRFGVAHEVEPVPGPVLAMVRAGQEAIDEALVGIGTVVGQIVVDFLGCRRQSRQIEREAANERSLVGFGSGGEAV